MARLRPDTSGTPLVLTEGPGLWLGAACKACNAAGRPKQGCVAREGLVQHLLGRHGSLLEKVAGVDVVKVDFAKKTATVTYDPDKAQPEALTLATANAGFPSAVQK